MSNNKHEDQLLTVAAFASVLNVTTSCVRRWLLERRIEAVKLGRLVRIRTSEADRLLAEGLRPRREAR
jgi:excisionase family DNA binding protein